MANFPEIKNSLFKITYDTHFYQTDDSFTYYVDAKNIAEATVALFAHVDELNDIDDIYTHLDDICSDSRNEFTFSETRITASQLFEADEEESFSDLIIEECDVENVKLDVNVFMLHIIDKSHDEIAEYILEEIKQSRDLIEFNRKNAPQVRKAKKLLKEIVDNEF